MRVFLRAFPPLLLPAMCTLSPLPSPLPSPSGSAPTSAPTCSDTLGGPDEGSGQSRPGDSHPAGARVTDSKHQSGTVPLQSPAGWTDSGSSETLSACGLKVRTSHCLQAYRPPRARAAGRVSPPGRGGPKLPKFKGDHAVKTARK
eukprot:763035-Hanusia_phi.AAC.1